jgi:hypothetical protein
MLLIIPLSNDLFINFALTFAKKSYYGFLELIDIEGYNLIIWVFILNLNFLGN